MSFLSAYLQIKEKADSSANREIGCDDVTLFREAMQGVKPLARTGKAILFQSGGCKPIRSDTSVLSAVQDYSSDDYQRLAMKGDGWSFVRPGLQRYTLRKLRRGYWPVQDELDLHGLNRDEAYQVLVAFLNGVVLLKYRCIRVIHGKGLGSGSRKPVLKKRIGSWLIQLDAVLAFCQAQPEQGGGGAVLVLLKNPDK